MSEDPPVPPGKLRSVVTYLEMTEPPSAAPPPAPDPNLRIERLQPVPADLYRRLYRAVGEPWLWWERLVWSDEELAEQLAAPGIEVHVLWSTDRPAGYFDLDRLQTGVIEKDNTRISVRTPVTGDVGSAFRAAGVALPPNIAETPSS